MSDDSKPLPCPFCGGEARYIGMGSFGRMVECPCGAELWPGARNEAKTIAAWNRRASPPVPARTRWRALRDAGLGQLVVRVPRIARPS